MATNQTLLPLYAVYAANILVAGWFEISSSFTKMALMLVYQLIYKGLWLLKVAQ